MKNFKITDASIITAIVLFSISLFVAIAVLHPGGQEKHYSDFSENTIHAGMSADALTK